MINESIDIVKSKDPKVARVLELELRRQQSNLELIASENLVSPEVMATMGSVLTNKYAEGYPGRRHYGGCEYVDMAERICIDRAKEIFGAKKIVIVTNTYHLYRALYIAKCFGVEAYGVGADDIYRGREYREVREILARDKDFAKCIVKPEPTFLGDTIDLNGDGNVTDDSITEE